MAKRWMAAARWQLSYLAPTNKRENFPICEGISIFPKLNIAYRDPTPYRSHFHESKEGLRLDAFWCPPKSIWGPNDKVPLTPPSPGRTTDSSTGLTFVL